MNLQNRVKPVTTLLGSLAIGIASLAAFAPSAQAAGLCSTNSQTGGISVSNMTYEGANANDCYGTLAGNLTPTGLTSLVNDTAQDPAQTWGDRWTYLAKADGTDGTATFQGLYFTLSPSTFGDNAGSWLLKVEDKNGSTPLNLPTTLDFIAGLKGGSGDTSLALWFFDDVVVNNGDNEGTFEIVFLNNGRNTPDLSHLDLLVRPSEVPEPASLGLLGLGLLGLGALRRRRVA